MPTWELIFIGGEANTKGQKAESGGAVLGRGSNPSPRVGGSGEHCKLPSGDLTLTVFPTAQRFSTIFSTENGLS